MKRVEYVMQWKSVEEKRWLNDDDRPTLKEIKRYEKEHNVQFPSLATRIIKREITETVVKKARKQ